MLSLTGYGDRLRMVAILAYVNAKPPKAGVSFTWEGSEEYDPISGTGPSRLRKSRMVVGRIKIRDGDESTFLAERVVEPEDPTRIPPSRRDKWR